MESSSKWRFETSMGWSSPDSIYVQGLDLCRDVIGKLSFGDMAFFELQGRLPTPAESAVFDAVLVTLVEHGLTPSTLAARMTYAGAPESIQAAVAASLLGLGSVFVGSMEGAARLLQEALRDAPAEADRGGMAARIVADFVARGERIPGFGHPIHRPDDPRAIRLFALADEYGVAGRGVGLMQAIGAEVDRARGRHVTINATGALGAILCDLGIDWRLARGIGAMSRAVGAVGHIREEIQKPLAVDLWLAAEEAAVHDGQTAE